MLLNGSGFLFFIFILISSSTISFSSCSATEFLTSSLEMFSRRFSRMAMGSVWTSNVKAWLEEGLGDFCFRSSSSWFFEEDDISLRADVSSSNMPSPSPATTEGYLALQQTCSRSLAAFSPSSWTAPPPLAWWAEGRRGRHWSPPGPAAAVSGSRGGAACWLWKYFYIINIFMFGGIESILDWSHQTASVILTRDASHTALAGGDGDGVEQASSFITLHVQAQVCYFLQLSKIWSYARWQGFIETNVNTSKRGLRQIYLQILCSLRKCIAICKGR